jgi:hypothetical protein
MTNTAIREIQAVSNEVLPRRHRAEAVTQTLNVLAYRFTPAATFTLAA